MKSFKYITQQDYEKLICLTEKTTRKPYDSPVRDLYPRTFDKEIEVYRKEMERIKGYPYEVRRIKTDETVRAILMLMFELPGLKIDDILNLTIECVEKSNWYPEITNSIKWLYAKYTSFMKELPGSNLKAESAERNGRNYYLFSNSEGNRLTVAAWNKILHKYFEKAGIELDTGGSGSLNYRFRHSYAFKQLIEIEAEYGCHLKEINRSTVKEKLAKRLKTGSVKNVSEITCDDYIRFYLANREQIRKDLPYWFYNCNTKRAVNYSHAEMPEDF